MWLIAVAISQNDSADGSEVNVISFESCDLR